MKQKKFLSSAAIAAMICTTGLAHAQTASTVQKQTSQTTTTTVVDGQSRLSETNVQSNTTVVQPPKVITVPAEPIVKSTSPVYDNELTEPVEPAALQPQTSENGIAYINGGVGEAERKAIQAVQGQYNLKIMTSDRQGRLVSHSALSIFDANNQSVLNITDLQPVFLANLPQGRYRIAVIYQGQTKSQNFVAGGKNKVINFVW